MTDVSLDGPSAALLEALEPEGRRVQRAGPGRPVRVRGADGELLPALYPAAVLDSLLSRGLVAEDGALSVRGAELLERRRTAAAERAGVLESTVAATAPPTQSLPPAPPLAQSNVVGIDRFRTAVAQATVVEARSGQTAQAKVASGGGSPRAGGAGGDDPELASDDPCPVTPLGFNDGTYFFFSPSGEFRAMTVRDLTPGGMISLFGAKIKWLIKTFQKRDKDGNPLNDFIHRPALIWLIGHCEAAGMYDPATVMRSVGVWAVEGSDQPAVHAGDEIYHGGTWHRAGYRVGGAAFRLRPAVPRPDFREPATFAEAAELRRGLGLWKWQRPTDAGLVFGWMGMVLLGSYPKWRAHLLGSAPHGSGKSTLGQLLAATAGPQIELLNDFTEAGLRHTLANEARGLILDEAEKEGGSAMRVGAVIELLRRMAGGDGARIVRGSLSGAGAVRSQVVGAACMLSVDPPRLLPADRSRIFRFELLPVSAGPDGAAAVTAAIARMQALSPRLRALAVDNAAVFARSFPAWRAALTESGCTGRQADVLAALLAGRDLLTTKEPPDSDSIDQMVVRLAPYIAELQREDDEGSDGRECLTCLYGYMPEVWRGGIKMTIGQMIIRGLQDGNPKLGYTNEYALGLRSQGLRLKSLDGAPALVVANRHPGLEQVFVCREKWRDGGWVTSLKRLGDDVKVSEPINFAGVKQRGVILPAPYLPAADEISEDLTGW